MPAVRDFIDCRTQLLPFFLRGVSSALPSLGHSRKSGNLKMAVSPSRNSGVSGAMAACRPCPNISPNQGGISRKPFLLGLLFLILTFISPTEAHAMDYLYQIAAQDNWAQKKGFCLVIENNYNGNDRCSLDDLELILGVADGSNWRYIRKRGWKCNLDYSVTAIVSSESAELWVNGEKVGSSSGGFMPVDGTLNTNRIVGWAKASADYIVLPNSISVTNKDSVQYSFEESNERPLPLMLFQSNIPRFAKWQTTPKVLLKIEVSFRLIQYPDLRQLSPFIDRYGQSVHADRANKVKSDEQLREDIKIEEAKLKEMPAPEMLDEYGGLLDYDWKEDGTGFFRVTEKDGYWWLITPEGNPCFYLGVSVVPAHVWPTTPVAGREFLFEWLPPKEGLWKSAWLHVHNAETVSFHASNLIRKYGEDWGKKAHLQSLKRLKSWGFSGGAKWGAPSSIVSTPVIGPGETPILVRHPDIFDPSIRAIFKKELEKQILLRLNDPNILGWSHGNEYHEIITRDEIKEILKKPPENPSRKALLDYALNEIYDGDLNVLSHAWTINSASPLEFRDFDPPSEDIERLRLYYADSYYEFLYRTVKSIDPNHLYLGFWIIPGWWESEEDWNLIARHCDVLGYDRYGHEFADERLLGLLEATDKPVFCGEFSFPGLYEGKRGFGFFHSGAKDEADAGEKYRSWIREAARNPYCVGASWFHYRDQPLTGRGPGEGERLVFDESHAFGLITETDRPKWELVTRMRQTNLSAAKWRLHAMQEGPPE